MPPTLALTCVGPRRLARCRPCLSLLGGRARSNTVLLSRVRAAGPDSLPSRSRRAASRRSAASRARAKTASRSLSSLAALSSALLRLSTLRAPSLVLRVTLI